MKVVKKKDNWSSAIITYLNTLQNESDLLVSYQYTDANGEERPCLVVEIKAGLDIRELISKIKQNVPCAKDNICYDMDIINYKYRIWPRESV